MKKEDCFVRKGGTGGWTWSGCYCYVCASGNKSMLRCLVNIVLYTGLQAGRGRVMATGINSNNKI